MTDATAESSGAGNGAERPEPADDADEDEREGAMVQEVAARAIKRLDLFEFLIIFAAAVVALVAGALVAWLLAAASELPFRGTWIVASLLFFVVPAALAWWTNREGGGGVEGGAGEGA